MYDRRCGKLARLAAQKPRRAALGDGAAPAAAPSRRFDAQRAEARERFAHRAVALGDQQRQAEHAAPALPFGDDVVGFAYGQAEVTLNVQTTLTPPSATLERSLGAALLKRARTALG